MRNALKIAAILVATGAVSHAADVLVRNQAELDAAIGAAQPGDSILLRNGIWNNISLTNDLIPSGTAQAPINIRAQTPGQVVITGPTSIFDVHGSHYTVSGLAFKDANDTLKAVRFRGDNARVYDNAILNFGRYNQIMWDVQDTAVNPTSSFDHNFIAGKKDRGVSLILDNSRNAQIKNNFFGHRDRGGPSGQTNGWETIRIGVSTIMNETLGAVIQNNYFEAAKGEEEIISDKTQNNFILNNTFQNFTKGRVTGRHGGGGLYEGNYFINALGFRVGNADDAIADHPGLVIRNNYLEGPNAKIILPGNQTTPTIENNTVVATTGSYISGEGTTGKMPLEYHNTTGGVINNNVFVSNDSSTAAVQAVTSNSITPTATGSGNYAYNAGNGTNSFTSGVPQAIKNLFSTSNPNLVRDAMGVLRPTGAAAGKGFTGTHAPLTRSSDVGASWMDPVMRLNKFTAGEFKFDGDLSGGAIGSTANNSGYLVTPATMKNNAGTATNYHTLVASGVSGSLGDRAFDNRNTSGMGGSGGTAQAVDRTWFRNVQAFTITGWFKTDGAQTIGNNASLVEQMDAEGGWSLRATQSGRLTLTIDDGSTSTSVTSDQSYTQQNQWTFFAVKFDQRPSSNEVEFFIGSSATDVTSAGVRSLSRTASSDTVLSDLVIGKGFDGLLDDIRLFTARRNITWTDEDGTSYTRTAVNHDFALLSIADLRTVRAQDLSPFEQSWAQKWGVDANGTWSTASNWIGGEPNFTDAVANFTGGIATPRTVTLGGAKTVGMINFANANRYTITGGTINLDVSIGRAEINLVSGNHTVASNINLLDDAIVNVAAGGATLTLSGNVAGTTRTVSKLGPGVLEIGRLDVGTLAIEQGVVRTIGPGSASIIRSLNIAPSSQLDLTNASLLVDYAGASPETAIRQMLADGRIGSSLTTTAMRIGYGDSGGDLLLKLTLAGDANLDGLVNISDLSALATAWQSSALWAGGDFDYSGFVDIVDLALLASNWQAGTLGPALLQLGLPLVDVPEPGLLAAGTVVIAGLARRRRVVSANILRT